MATTTDCCRTAVLRAVEKITQLSKAAQRPRLSLCHPRAIGAFHEGTSATTTTVAARLETATMVQKGGASEEDDKHAHQIDQDAD